MRVRAGTAVQAVGVGPGRDRQRPVRAGCPGQQATGGEVISDREQFQRCRTAALSGQISTYARHRWGTRVWGLKRISPWAEFGRGGLYDPRPWADG